MLLLQGLFPHQRHPFLTCVSPRPSLPAGHESNLMHVFTQTCYRWRAGGRTDDSGREAGRHWCLKPGDTFPHFKKKKKKMKIWNSVRCCTWAAPRRQTAEQLQTQRRRLLDLVPTTTGEIISFNRRRCEVIFKSKWSLKRSSRVLMLFVAAVLFPAISRVSPLQNDTALRRRDRQQGWKPFMKYLRLHRTNLSQHLTSIVSHNNNGRVDTLWEKSQISDNKNALKIANSKIWDGYCLTFWTTTK